MKRVEFENSRGLNLVGNFWEADSDLGIVMAHGFAGYKEEKNGKFTEIAESLNEAGFNVLAFDFSGCGESDDDIITVEKEVEDLNAAVEFMRSENVKRIGVLGLSQGGLVALRRGDDDVEAMVLMAPVTDALENYSEEKLTDEQRKDLEEKGRTLKIRYRKARKRHVITKEAIEDKENVDKDELLGNIDTPILFLHGRKDDTVPIQHSRNAVEKLEDAEIVELKDDHYFDESVEEVAALSKRWFEEKMK